METASQITLAEQLNTWVGLTRAFLHAGARYVVATLWPVDDWATAALMERFYGAGDRPSVLLGGVCEHGR